MSDSRLLLRAAALFFLLLVLVAAAWPLAAHAQPGHDNIIYVVQPGDRLVDIAARFGVSASAIVRANGLTNADTIFPGQRLIIPSPTANITPTATRTPAPVPGGPGAAPGPVPGGPASGGPGSAPALPATTYTIQLGDTLASIARQFGVSVAALQEANRIANPDLIWVGQKLLIPQPGATAPQATATTATGANVPFPATATPRADATAGPVTSPSAPATSAPAASAPVTSAPATSAPAATRPPTATPEITPTAPRIHIVQPGDTLSKIAQKYGVSVEALVAVNGLGSADLIGVGVRLIIPAKGSDGNAASAPVVAGRATKFVASISQQRCWLYNGETVIARWICSTGRRGAATRPGTYKIQSKLPKAYGSTWNIWMPYWLGIYWAGASENGIHGLPWDAKTGVQIWSGNVGKPITFGCLMLDNVNAKMLYDLAWIGMPVVIRP
jgi:LysM repeat protein